MNANCEEISLSVTREEIALIWDALCVLSPDTEEACDKLDSLMCKLAPYASGEI